MKYKIHIRAWCWQSEIVNVLCMLGLKHEEDFETNLSPFEISEMIYQKGFNVMIKHFKDYSAIIFVDDMSFCMR